jgi:5-formyltetrahydrofolate cyclo-ligase
MFRCIHAIIMHIQNYSHDDTVTDKQTIRRNHQATRKALSEPVRARASQALCARIQTLPVYQHATHIAMYQAIDGEIDLHPLWVLAENAGKTCYMPVMNSKTKTLLFLPVTLKTPQQTNSYHIAEPQVSHAASAPLDTLDLMLMPLVAFDNHGTRLGRGAGYYDRALAHKKPSCLLGVAYEFQHHAFLPPEPWDIPLDGVVTEKTMHWSTS